jgi:hypothetical protein
MKWSNLLLEKRDAKKLATRRTQIDAKKSYAKHLRDYIATVNEKLSRNPRQLPAFVCGSDDLPTRIHAAMQHSCRLKIACPLCGSVGCCQYTRRSRRAS